MLRKAFQSVLSKPNLPLLSQTANRPLLSLSRGLYLDPKCALLVSGHQRYFSTNEGENQEEIVVDTQNQEAEPVHIEKSETSSYQFKAETKKILDIMAKSIYTEKDVFIRELLSNSSDALEKQRYYVSSGKDSGMGSELQVSITTNEARRQIIFHDSGIGMTKEELIDAIGTIAKSGSKEFMEKITKSDATQSSVTTNIIGQFGVGFYSSFVVADTVEVLSKSNSHPDAHLWVSDGSGEFEVSKVSNPGFERGTKIILHLKPECASFCRREEIVKAVNKYSKFMSFPIILNGERLNVVSAIWAKSKSDISDDDYLKFWEFISNSKTPYKYKMHFSADAPLSITSLLYIPSSHMEKFGMSMEESEINLYSRKILIKSKCRELLPNYLRFVKGVVDCEDLPLNISREGYQDSLLITKLNKIITKRIIKTLVDESKKNPEGYLTWYGEFKNFIKEGLATDSENADQLFSLARFEANFTYDTITIDEYLKKMKPDQNKIYFLLAPNRDAAECSPYMEPFKGGDTPVIYTYEHVDEMVFRQMASYKNMKIINIEASFDEVAKDTKSTEHNKASGLPEDDITTFCLWLKVLLSPFIHNSLSSFLENRMNWPQWSTSSRFLGDSLTPLP